MSPDPLGDALEGAIRRSGRRGRGLSGVADGDIEDRPAPARHVSAGAGPTRPLSGAPVAADTDL